MKSDFCGNIKFSIFGESHSPEIGITVEGLPSGFRPDFEKLQSFLDRRAPGKSELATPRKEADIPEFTSGIADGKLTGEALTAIIKNTNTRSGDYSELKTKPRPGHADFTAMAKHGDKHDYRGGGHFSGRLTAPLCVLGGILIQVLENEGIEISSRIIEIAGERDDKKMKQAILDAKAAGDSVGGIIECEICGAPVGLGDAMFDGMESRIAELVFGIPAVKGIEFGAGFEVAKMRGSENNDPFEFCGGKVVTKTNNCGGILGGITNGMPIVFRAAIKPTPSIALEQDTVDLETMDNAKLSVHGRHDPCIVPRALPCIESAAAIAIYDAMLDWRKEQK